MKKIILFLPFLFVLGCGSTKNVSKKQSKEEIFLTVFDEQYYQNLEKNIVRLHHLMQGTFTAYSEDAAERLKSWNVTGGDSVVLCSVPLGEVAKHGFWVYSYEFMTSLPNEPIYTTIKQIKEISRDTFLILHYKTTTKLTLKEVLNPTILNQKIVIDKLEKTDKETMFVRETSAKFVGNSVLYEDEQCNCLRQNVYTIDPNFYNVEANYYNKDSKNKIEREKRPNYLVRRTIDDKIMDKIAAKE